MSCAAVWSLEPPCAPYGWGSCLGVPRPSVVVIEATGRLVRPLVGRELQLVFTRRYTHCKGCANVEQATIKNTINHLAVYKKHNSGGLAPRWRNAAARMHDIHAPTRRFAPPAGMHHKKSALADASSLSDLRLMDELRRGFFTPLCWCWCWRWCCWVALNLPLSFGKAVLTPCLLAGWARRALSPPSTGASA